MTEKEIYTIDFETPIDFNITVKKMESVNTVDGKKIWIEGIGVFGSETKETAFYCPEALEYILRDIEVDIEDELYVMFLGKRRSGRRIKEFYAKKVKKENGKEAELEVS